MTRPGGGSIGNARRLKVKVKTGKDRTVSQKAWLERQLNDPYVAEAKRLGYRSRAAFKLAEIDDKYRFLKPGMMVIVGIEIPRGGKEGREIATKTSSSVN